MSSTTTTTTTTLLASSSSRATTLVKFYKQASNVATSIALLTPDEIKQYRVAGARCVLLEFSYESTAFYLRKAPAWTQQTTEEFTEREGHPVDTLDPFVYLSYIRADIVSRGGAALYVVQCAQRVALVVLLRPYARYSVFADALHHLSAPSVFAPTVYKLTGIVSPAHLYAAYEALNARLIRAHNERLQAGDAPAWLRSDAPELVLLSADAALNAHSWTELHDAVGARFDVELALRLLEQHAPEHFSVVTQQHQTVHSPIEPTQIITLCNDAASGVRYLDSAWTVFPIPRATLLPVELHLDSDGVLLRYSTLQLKGATPLHKWMRRRWYVHPLQLNVERYRQLYTDADTLAHALSKEVAASLHALYIGERAAPVAVGADAAFTINYPLLRLLFGEVFAVGQHASVAVIAVDELAESPLPGALFAAPGQPAAAAVSLTEAISTAFSIYAERIAQFSEHRNTPSLTHTAPAEHSMVATSSGEPKAATIAFAAPLLVSRALSSVHVLSIDMKAEYAARPERVYVPPSEQSVRYAHQIREMTLRWQIWPVDDDADALKHLCESIVLMRNTFLDILHGVGITEAASLTHPREKQLAQLLVRTAERDLIIRVQMQRADEPRRIQPLRCKTYENVALLNALGTELTPEGRAWLEALFEKQNWTVHDVVLELAPPEQLVNVLQLARAFNAEEQRDAEERSIKRWLRRYRSGDALNTPLSEIYAAVRRSYAADADVMEQLNAVAVELICAKDAAMTYRTFTQEFGAPAVLGEYLFPAHVARRRWRWSLPMSMDEVRMATRCEPEMVMTGAVLKDDVLLYEPCDDAFLLLKDVAPDTALGRAYSATKLQRATALVKWRARMHARIVLFWSDAVVRQRVLLRHFPLLKASHTVPTATRLVVDLSSDELAVLDPDAVSYAELDHFAHLDAVMLHVARYKRMHDYDTTMPAELRTLYSSRSTMTQLLSQAQLLLRDKAWSALLSADQRAALVERTTELGEWVALLNDQLVHAVTLYRDRILEELLRERLSALPSVDALTLLRETVDALTLRNYIESYEQTMRSISARITAQIDTHLAPVLQQIRALPTHVAAPLMERAREMHSVLHSAAEVHSVARIAVMRQIGAELPYTAVDSAVHEAMKPLRSKLDTLEHDVLRVRIGAERHPVSVQPIGATVESSKQEDRRLRALLDALQVTLTPASATLQPISLATANSAVVAHLQNRFANAQKQHAAISLWALYAWWFFVDGAGSGDELSKRVAAALDEVEERAHATEDRDIVDLEVSRALIVSAFRAIAPQERFVRYTTTLYLRLFAAHYVAASALSSIDELQSGEIASIFSSAKHPTGNKLEEFRIALQQEEQEKSAALQFNAAPLLDERTIFTNSLFVPRILDALQQNGLPATLRALGAMANDVVARIMNTHDDLEQYRQRMFMLVEALAGTPTAPFRMERGAQLSADVLRAERTRAQTAFFRPDPREAGMLSAALNTFFCAEIDPRRDATSLARQVWHDRLAVLHAEGQREPFGTGSVSRGWNAAQKRARILGRWTPADVAEAAVQLAMDQMASNGPAGVASMPLALLARVLWALISHAEFVRWLRRYGLDAHAYVDETQRPPFRRVVTVARRQAGQAYVEVDELMARELYNALLKQEAHSDGAAQRFMRLAARSYNTATNEAHDLWRLTVFGPLRDHVALLLDGSVAPGQSPIDTLDLQQQLLALTELHEMLGRAVATLSADDKSAAQALERQALLSAALYFVLTFLYAPEHTDNLFLLQVHPDGDVLYDSFHGDVVPYIARNVYGWPEWADVVTQQRGQPESDLRGFGALGLRMMRTIDDQWLMRTNALLAGRQLKHGAYTTAEYNAVAERELQTLWVLLCMAMADSEYPPPKTSRPALERVLVRYPRGPVPYELTDLKAGQAMVFIKRSSGGTAARGSLWLDVSPLAGLDTRGSVARGMPEGRDGAFAHEHADFAPELRFSYYEWRVGRQYYLRPAFAANNSVPADAGTAPIMRRHNTFGNLVSHLLQGDRAPTKAVYKDLLLPELLLPPNSVLFFTLEWLLRNPSPSVKLVHDMATGASSLVTGEELGIFRPAMPPPPAERQQQHARLKREIDSLKTQWAAKYTEVALAFDTQVRTIPAVTETLDKALDDFYAKTRLEEARTSALVQRIDIAERGVLEYSHYAERLIAVVEPRVSSDVLALSEQYPVPEFPPPGAYMQWLRVPEFKI